jgi:hypothetical protein
MEYYARNYLGDGKHKKERLLVKLSIKFQPFFRLTKPTGGGVWPPPEHGYPSPALLWVVG